MNLEKLRQISLELPKFQRLWNYFGINQKPAPAPEAKPHFLGQDLPRRTTIFKALQKLTRQQQARRAMSVSLWKDKEFKRRLKSSRERMRTSSRKTPQFLLILKELLLESRVGIHECPLALHEFKGLLEFPAVLPHQIRYQHCRTSRYSRRTVDQHVCLFQIFLHELKAGLETVRNPLCTAVVQIKHYDLDGWRVSKLQTDCAHNSAYLVGLKIRQVFGEVDATDPNAAFVRNRLDDALSVVIPLLVLEKHVKLKMLKRSSLRSLKDRELSQLRQENEQRRDEIIQEVRYSSVEDNEYMNKLLKIKDQAQIYAKKIQIQSKKNSDLKSVIKAVEDKLMSQKYKKSDQRDTNDQQEHSLQGLLKKQQKLQYDTQQIIQKHNWSLAQIDFLKEQVKAARSERVIYSGIFKNLQRQIRQHEFQFKKLLIQRAQAQRQYEQFMVSFKKQEAQARRKLQEIKNSKMCISHQNTDVEHNYFKVDSDDHLLLEDRLPKSSDMASLNQPQPNTFQNHDILIKKIRTATGLENLEQIIQLADHIQGINQRLLEELTRASESVQKQQQQLQNLMKKSQELKEMSSEQKRGKQKILTQIKSFQAKQQQLQSKMIEQRKNLQDLIKTALIPLGEKVKISPAQIGLTSLNDSNLLLLMQKIQQKINQITQDVPAYKQENIDQSGEKEDILMGNSLGEILDRGEKLKEADRLMTRKDFIEQCNNEINKIQAKKIIRKSRKI